MHGPFSGFLPQNGLRDAERRNINSLSVPMDWNGQGLEVFKRTRAGELLFDGPNVSLHVIEVRLINPIPEIMRPNGTHIRQVIRNRR